MAVLRQKRKRLRRIWHPGPGSFDGHRTELPEEVFKRAIRLDAVIIAISITDGELMNSTTINEA